MHIPNTRVTRDGRSNHKNFWKYIKGIHKDQHGIPPLNDDNGNTVTSSKEKANILNRKFQSVFTSENTTDKLQ